MAREFTRPKTAPKTATRPPFTPSDDRRPQPGTSLPRPNQSGTRGLPFLKAADIGNEGDRGTIGFSGNPARRNANGKFGPELIFGVIVDGTGHAFSVREDSENHETLYDLFNGGTPQGDVPYIIKASQNGGLYISLGK